MSRFNLATSFLLFGILCISGKAYAATEQTKAYYQCIACAAGEDPELLSAFAHCETMEEKEAREAIPACFVELYQERASLETTFKEICSSDDKNDELWDCFERKIADMDQQLKQMEDFQNCLKELNTTCKQE